MKGSAERFWTALLVLGLVLTTPGDAWAYVDPGTGSYLFQLAAAGFLAGMFTIRRYWDAVKARVRGARSDDRPE
jgi:hypothetical protein